MDILSAVPNESILGTLLLIILCDLFLEFENIFASFADDTIPYAAGENTEEVITELLLLLLLLILLLLLYFKLTK